MEIEKEDIQGLIARGYKNLPSSAYLILQFTSKKRASQYLETITSHISNAIAAPEIIATHAAFTYKGLEFLGVHKDTLSSFSRPFKEGMTESHRQFVLGDIEYNNPNTWNWGGANNPTIHMVLMLFAVNDTKLREVYSNHQNLFSTHDILEIKYLSTTVLKDKKEHFGFRDSISQPIMRGFGKSNELPKEDTTPTGEFILGYKNWYDQYPDSPHVKKDNDIREVLSNKKENQNLKDLGRNGSYMVFRQISQDVLEFWNYMKSTSSEPNVDKKTENAIQLASKMVGRWPSGAPLIKTPEKDNPDYATDNDFKYWNEDFNGLKCPLGSHIRRTNPRDWLLTEKTDVESKEMSQKHRLLRRGRSYGDPLVDSMVTEDIVNANDDSQPRGLHFICFVGDITRQFEFIQNSWVKFHKFGGLYDDSDPLIGTHYSNSEITSDTFTVQSKPFRRRYCNMPAFTKIEGGEYFFFPGIKAFQYIASI
ncbi:Dyp-type peroxidase [Aquimarina sediminis]|uniref:Dyp-type peroxidase n=1 Tax=Aquimarina sediminis TaxID=2070536 RepID=UPI000CA000EB|nr:peroxidase [Aquimarina sediminis]